VGGNGDVISAGNLLRLHLCIECFWFENLRSELTLLAAVFGRWIELLSKVAPGGEQCYDRSSYPWIKKINYN
jgi:hypothetical protein